MTRTWEEILCAPCVSVINEPIDFTVEVPKSETATERARRLWFKDDPTKEEP